MMRLNHRASIFLLVTTVSIALTPIYSQDSERSVRNIRVKKLSQNWKGKTITLIMIDDEEVTGKLIKADFSNFQIEDDETERIIPISQVQAVKLSPGAAEFALTCITGGLGYGLFWGFISLSAPETKQETQIMTGLLGMGIGSWLGFNTFYREDVIVLD